LKSSVIINFCWIKFIEQSIFVLPSYMQSELQERRNVNEEMITKIIG